MKKTGTMFIKNLRYLCLVGVIALGLITIVGSNGGGGGGGGPTTTTDTTTPTTDGGEVTVGEGIDTSWVTFRVENALSLIATENIGTSTGRRSVRRDGRAIPTYVFRKPTPEAEAKARQAEARRAGEEVGCNLIAIDENGVASDAIESLEELNVMYTVLSKDGKTVYVVLDPDYMHNAQGTIGSTNCMMFAVDLQTNEYTCLDQGYAPQKMDTQFRQTISSSQVKPIQLDDNGNIYYLGRPFTVNSNTWCDQWDNSGNCVNEHTDYWIEFDWNTQPVIRKISVKKDADGHPLYNEDGYLLYEDPVSLTPDNNYIDSFLVSKNGILVYTFQNWETGQGGIKMYADGATNALTDDTTGWWGNMFYMVGDSGTVIFGSSAGDAWGNAGIKFAQKHPVVAGAKVALQLNTSLFTSRNNSPTPSRIIMGDDGYIYGLFNEDTGYWDESSSSWVSQARINLFRILPYRQTPIVSIVVTGNWWDAMRGFDVQISKGFAYYVQTDKHAQGLYSDRDVIKITKLATGETTTLLNESHTEGGYTIWGDRYELYSWKLVGSKIFFSGFDNTPPSQVVTGEIDVTKVRQGKPSSEYLTIQPAASALGESAKIKDMEIVRPEVVYDPVGAPVITNIYKDPENRYSASIDFSKYMNRTDVNSKVSINDVAADEEVAFSMKVWSYRTLHLIFDTDATNAVTDPLAANSLYGISVDGSAYDYANDWQLDMADNPLLSTTFKTVPENGWYQSTAIALEGYSDGSVGKYVAKSGSDTWLQYYRLLGGTEGFDKKNFKVELSLQHLSEWGRITLRLNDAKKIDWANVDWTNTIIEDSEGYQWKWRDGHREDVEGNQYYWCNNEVCGAGVEGIYDQEGNVYEYIQGHDEDVHGNQYFWYWDDATNQHGYRWYDQSGTYQGIILWVEGYYTDENGTIYRWSFGEYRDENDPENIVDWSSGHTYTWHSGHYEENGTEVTMPALEWVQGVYKASDGTIISESTYWNMTWVDGYYYQIDPATELETGETATYYGEVYSPWHDTVSPEDMAINESKNNWEAKLWNFDFSFGQGSQLWGEYRRQTWETTQVYATTDQLLRREWQKIAISVYGPNLVISVVDADGQEIAVIEKTDYHNASRTNSGLYFLDLNIEEDVIFMDNVVITELDDSGNSTGNILFSEDFSSADLDPAFSNTRYYQSDW